MGDKHDRKDLVKKLEKRGIRVHDGVLASDDVLHQLVKRHDKDKPLDPPAELHAGVRLLVPVTLGAGCHVVGVVQADLVLAQGVFIGPNAVIQHHDGKQVTIGEGTSIDGVVENCLEIGANNKISRATHLQQCDCIGSGNIFGAAAGDDAVSQTLPCYVFNCTIGDDTKLTGQFLNSSIQNTVKVFGGEVRDSVLHGGVHSIATTIDHSTVLSGATLLHSTIHWSVIGEQSWVREGSFIERSCLAAFQRPGSEDVERVVTLRARVSDSLVYGGSFLADGVVVRGRSAIGPFVHLGAGSETKASLIRGFSSSTSVEVPHRSYLGNTMALVAKGQKGKPLLLDPEAARDAARLPMTHALTGKETHSLHQEHEGFHEPTTLTFTKPDAEDSTSIEAEGINIGALTTTSNFDPRAGGSKWPTLIGGGMRCGVGTVIQAPAYLPEEGLLASGAKLPAGRYDRGSLLVGGSGDFVEKKDYAGQITSLLGRDISKKIELTFGYLHNLEAMIQAIEEEYAAAPEAPGHDNEPDARESKRYVLRFEQECLHAQIREMLPFVRRYMALVKQVHEDLLARRDDDKADGQSVEELPLFKELQVYANDAPAYESMLKRLDPAGQEK